MMAKETGGPAFPHVIQADARFSDSSGDGAYVSAPGLSLRDYFAAQSIRGGADAICDQLDPANEGYGKAEIAAHVERHARAAYLLADAMLAERERS